MRTFKLCAVLALSGVLAGCATMTVSSHVERGLDASRYRTFDWGPADSLPTGDPRLDGDLFFRDHMMGAVEKQLTLRGYTQLASGTPDLLVHYHANIASRIDVNRVDREFGYCYGVECSARVIDYEAGTLIIDIVDARSNRVIWRGWAQTSVENVIGHPDRLSRMINDAVERMLARFPRSI